MAWTNPSTLARVSSQVLWILFLLLTSNILKTPVLPYPAVFVLHPRPRSGDKNSGTDRQG
jgi:hypothetical protein